MRAFASGWTELSVGTEVAVREITRLRNAGAFTARVLPMAELAAGQQSLGLLWQAKYANLPGPAAGKALAAFVALFQPWNQYLDRLASATPDAGPGDIAGLFPSATSDVTMTGTLTEDGASATTSVSLSCGMLEPTMSACAMSVANRDDLSEQFRVRANGIVLQHQSAGQGPEGLLFQVVDLPIIEFAPAIGTRIIQDTPQYTDRSNPAVRAAIKVTRRTYPAAPVQALGGTVMAIEVVLDYEIAILNASTRSQGDILMRERRWFSPLGARVKTCASFPLALPRTAMSTTGCGDWRLTRSTPSACWCWPGQASSSGNPDRYCSMPPETSWYATRRVGTRSITAGATTCQARWRGRRCATSS